MFGVYMWNMTNWFYMKIKEQILEKRSISTEVNEQNNETEWSPGTLLHLWELDL